jgi:hypothetical protein
MYDVYGNKLTEIKFIEDYDVKKQFRKYDSNVYKKIIDNNSLPDYYLASKYFTKEELKDDKKEKKKTKKNK